MLPKSRRLRLNRDFERVFSLGKSLTGRFLKIKFLKEGNSPACFAVVVSNKVSKRAVVRNRIRRRLWSSILKIDSISLNGLKIAVVVKPEASGSSFNDLSDDFYRLITKKSL